LRWTFIVLLVSPYFVDVAWQKFKITTMRFNFLKLLDRILFYFFRRRYAVTSFLMMSRLRHHYVVMW